MQDKAALRASLQARINALESRPPSTPRLRDAASRPLGDAPSPSGDASLLPGGAPLPPGNAYLFPDDVPLSPGAVPLSDDVPLRLGDAGDVQGDSASPVADRKTPKFVLDEPPASFGAPSFLGDAFSLDAAPLLGDEGDAQGDSASPVADGHCACSGKAPSVLPVPARFRGNSDSPVGASCPDPSTADSSRSDAPSLFGDAFPLGVASRSLGDEGDVRVDLSSLVADGGSSGGADRARPKRSGCAASSRSPRPLAAEEQAFRKIERLACSREQASALLRRRLVRDGFDEAAADAAIERALACGLVDDLRYADVLVRSRLAQGKGLRGIRAELADLGIDADDVPAFEERSACDGEDGELSRALAVLDRKPPRAKNARDAAYRRLVQKGYSSAVASSAARRWCERRDDLA